jgi:hypothetical protein
MSDGNTYNNYAKYEGPGFKPGVETLELFKTTNRFSILNTYNVLISYMVAYEKGLSDSMKNVEGSNAADIDQGTLLQLQAMVQVWGTISATSTGIIRMLGDTLLKIVQNIR